MKNIEIESYGKINLSLDVLYKRNDGYHEIDTIMQQISLGDILKIQNTNGKDISIKSNKMELPVDSTNLVYQAWDQIKEKTGIERGVNISIEKQIPIAAGLAGGSSNAAATLRALNELWDLELSDLELHNIAVNIGADVPYCLFGGTAHATGIGEKLSRLNSFKGKHILLFNPGIQISTADVYKSLQVEKSNRIDMKSIIRYVENDDLIKLGENMENIMEKTVIDKYPIIGIAKREMNKYGALGSLMSGSGATVFGLFEDLDKLIYCKEKLKRLDGILIECQTI